MLKLTQEFKELGYVSNFINNSILNNYWNTDLSTWIRLFTFEGEYSIPVANNYFGTDKLDIIKKVICDFDEFSTFNDLVETPYLTEAPDTIYPFVTSLQLEDPYGNKIDYAQAGENYITLKFNTAMDTAQELGAYFGPDYPYTDFLIQGEWLDAKTWKGKFTVYTTTGDGLEHLLVMGARSAKGYEMTKDFRLVFNISSIGAESLDVFAEAKDNEVKLTWIATNEDLAIGINIYRSQYKDRGYEIINDSLINIADTTYGDTTISSNTTYYYKMAIIYSDLTESVSETPIEVTTKDKTAPSISHEPVYTINEGNNLVIKAYVSDNILATNVKLYYRTPGDQYTCVDMSTYDSMDNNWAWKEFTYYATITSDKLSLSGIEYYIEVTDYDGNMTSYRSSSNPISVDVVKEGIITAPVVSSLSTYSSDIYGGGYVYIYGNNFGRNTKVYLNGILCSSTYHNSSLIGFNVPASDYVGHVTLIVENEDGQTAVRSNIFEYIGLNIKPEIEGVSASMVSINGGNELYIFGYNFSSDANVYFGNVAAMSVEVISERLIKVITPQYSSEATVNIKVVNDKNNYGILYNAISFKRIDNITNDDFKFSRTSGHYLGGDIIRITGPGFNQFTKVFFGQNAAETIYVNSTTILAVTPLSSVGQTDVRIQVSADIEYTLVNSFEFNNDVVNMNINGLSINKGQLAGGELISIFGNNFRKDVVVYFGTNKATVVSVTDSVIIVNVPNGTSIGNVDVIVKDSAFNSQATLSDGYKYINYTVSLNEGIDTITLGSIWNDAGVSSNYSLNVVVSGNVNSQQTGTYVITYKCYEGTELVATIKRFVKVVDKELEITIRLNEGITTLKVGDEYVEAGATSNVGKVTVDNSQVNTSEAGIYKVTYSVEYQGKTYYKTRYVYVYEDGE